MHGSSSSSGLKLRYVNDARPFWKYIVSATQYYEELYNYFTTEQYLIACGPFLILFLSLDIYPAPTHPHLAWKLYDPEESRRESESVRGRVKMLSMIVSNLDTR